MIDKHEWRASAVNALAKWMKRRRKPFTIERARVSIGDKIEQPNDCRWWGGVTKTALSDGLMRRVPGWQPAASSHGAPKPVYLPVRARG